MTGLCRSSEAACAELDRMLELWAKQVKRGTPMTKDEKLEVFGGPKGEHKNLLSNVRPRWRDARRRETNSRLRPLKSLPRKSINICSMCHCSPPISPPGNQSATRTTAVSVTLSIVSLAPSIVASAANPCSIAIMGVSSKFGVLGRKFY